MLLEVMIYFKCLFLSAEFIQYMFYSYLVGMLQIKLKHSVSLHDSPSIQKKKKVHPFKSVLI